MKRTKHFCVCVFSPRHLGCLPWFLNMYSSKTIVGVLKRRYKNNKQKIHSKIRFMKCKKPKHVQSSNKQSEVTTKLAHQAAVHVNPASTAARESCTHGGRERAGDAEPAAKRVKATKAATHEASQAAASASLVGQAASASLPEDRLNGPYWRPQDGARASHRRAERLSSKTLRRTAGPFR